MFLKLNRFLRKVVLVISALCIIFKIADNKSEKKKEHEEAFQTVEFDDIW